MRIMFVLAAASVAACATMETVSCDRACRLETARAVAGGEVSAGIRFTENGAATSPGQSWLAGAKSRAIHGEYASDTGDEAIVVGTAVGADQRPAVFGLRIKRTGGKAAEAELLVARNGEASLSPPAIPLARDPLFDQVVPPEQRTPGRDMIAAANAYFDGIESDDGGKVPVTEGCNRVENGVQTTRTARFVEAGCNSLAAFVYITKVRDRRYSIVDEARGVVVGIVAFDVPGGDYKRIVNGQETTRHYDPRSLYLIEAFKIVDGKIAKIEATMRNIPLGGALGW